MSIADEVAKISEKGICHAGQLDMFIKAEEKRRRMIANGLLKPTEQKVAFMGAAVSSYSFSSK